MVVSIITASYNSAETIKETIYSILKQDFLDFEYIIIDGGSTDDTVSIIKDFIVKFKERNIPFSYLSEKDDGIYDAWNKGIDLAKGDWISFVGSDDVLTPDALSIYNNTLIKNQPSSYDFIHSNVEVIKNGKKVSLINGMWSWRVFRRHMCIAHVGAWHNKKYFHEYGVFNISYKITGDYEILLRSRDALNCLYIDAITAKMAFGGVSTRNVKRVFMETLKAKIETGKVSPLLCWFDFYWSSFKRALKNFLVN